MTITEETATKETLTEGIEPHPCLFPPTEPGRGGFPRIRILLPFDTDVEIWDVCVQLVSVIRHFHQLNLSCSKPTPCRVTQRACSLDDVLCSSGRPWVKFEMHEMHSATPGSMAMDLFALLRMLAEVGADDIPTECSDSIDSLQSHVLATYERYAGSPHPLTLPAIHSYWRAHWFNERGLRYSQDGESAKAFLMFTEARDTLPDCTEIQLNYILAQQDTTVFEKLQLVQLLPTSLAGDAVTMALLVALHFTFDALRFARAVQKRWHFLETLRATGDATQEWQEIVKLDASNLRTHEAVITMEQYCKQLWQRFGLYFFLAPHSIPSERNRSDALKVLDTHGWAEYRVFGNHWGYLWSLLRHMAGPSCTHKHPCMVPAMDFQQMGVFMVDLVAPCYCLLRLTRAALEKLRHIDENIMADGHYASSSLTMVLRDPGAAIFLRLSSCGEEGDAWLVQTETMSPLVPGASMVTLVDHNSRRVALTFDDGRICVFVFSQSERFIFRDRAAVLSESAGPVAVKHKTVCFNNYRDAASVTVFMSVTKQENGALIVLLSEKQKSGASQQLKAIWLGPELDREHTMDILSVRAVVRDAELSTQTPTTPVQDGPRRSARETMAKLNGHLPRSRRFRLQSGTSVDYGTRKLGSFAASVSTASSILTASGILVKAFPLSNGFLCCFANRLERRNSPTGNPRDGMACRLVWTALLRPQDTACDWMPDPTLTKIVCLVSNLRAYVFDCTSGCIVQCFQCPCMCIPDGMAPVSCRHSADPVIDGSASIVFHKNAANDSLFAIRAHDALYFFHSEETLSSKQPVSPTRMFPHDLPSSAILPFERVRSPQIQTALLVVDKPAHCEVQASTCVVASRTSLALIDMSRMESTPVLDGMGDSHLEKPNDVPSDKEKSPKGASADKLRVIMKEKRNEKPGAKLLGVVADKLSDKNGQKPSEKPGGILGTITGKLGGKPSEKSGKKSSDKLLGAISTMKDKSGQKSNAKPKVKILGVLDHMRRESAEKHTDGQHETPDRNSAKLREAISEMRGLRQKDKRAPIVKAKSKHKLAVSTTVDLEEQVDDEKPTSCSCTLHIREILTRFTQPHARSSGISPHELQLTVDAYADSMNTDIRKVLAAQCTKKGVTTDTLFDYMFAAQGEGYRRHRLHDLLARVAIYPRRDVASLWAPMAREMHSQPIVGAKWGFKGNEGSRLHRFRTFLTQDERCAERHPARWRQISDCYALGPEVHAPSRITCVSCTDDGCKLLITIITGLATLWHKSCSEDYSWDRAISWVAHSDACHAAKGAGGPRCALARSGGELCATAEAEVKVWSTSDMELLKTLQCKCGALAEYVSLSECCRVVAVMSAGGWSVWYDYELVLFASTESLSSIITFRAGSLWNDLQNSIGISVQRTSKSPCNLVAAHMSRSGIVFAASVQGRVDDCEKNHVMILVRTDGDSHFSRLLVMSVTHRVDYVYCTDTGAVVIQGHDMLQVWKIPRAKEGNRIPPSSVSSLEQLLLSRSLVATPLTNKDLRVTWNVCSWVGTMVVEPSLGYILACDNASGCALYVLPGAGENLAGLHGNEKALRLTPSYKVNGDFDGVYGAFSTDGFVLCTGSSLRRFSIITDWYASLCITTSEAFSKPLAVVDRNVAGQDEARQQFHRPLSPAQLMLEGDGEKKKWTMMVNDSVSRRFAGVARRAVNAGRMMANMAQKKADDNRMSQARTTTAGFRESMASFVLSSSPRSTTSDSPSPRGTRRRDPLTPMASHAQSQLDSLLPTEGVTERHSAPAAVVRRPRARMRDNRLRLGLTRSNSVRDARTSTATKKQKNSRRHITGAPRRTTRKKLDVVREDEDEAEPEDIKPRKFRLHEVWLCAYLKQAVLPKLLPADVIKSHDDETRKTEVWTVTHKDKGNLMCCNSVKTAKRDKKTKEVQKKGKKTHLQCFLFTCVFGHFFQAVSLCFFSTIPRIGENIQKFHNCCGKHFFMQLPVSKKTCRKYNLFFNVDFLNI